MAEEIHGLVIPKYGMVMAEGLISAWHLEEGASVSRGDELVDIETEKVTNSYESPCAGILRRKLVDAGQSAPIGALFGIIASLGVDDAEIDAYVDEFQAKFATAEVRVDGPVPEFVDLKTGCIRFLKMGEGEGPPVVLVHGFGGDLNSWMFNQDALAGVHSVYALDLPSHGRSQGLSDLRSIDDLVMSLEGFLDAKGLTSVHLVGHSLGGGICAKIAINRPQQIASLTLVAPIGLGKEINTDFVYGLLDADRRVEMKKVLESLFYDQTLVSRDMIQKMLQSKRIDGAVDNLRSIAERCIGTRVQVTNVREELSRLSVPVQIVWGQSDEIIPDSHVTDLPEHILVHRIERAGHMVHMERAAEVNRHIMRIVGVKGD